MKYRMMLRGVCFFVPENVKLGDHLQHAFSEHKRTVDTQDLVDELHKKIALIVTKQAIKICSEKIDYVNLTS